MKPRSLTTTLLILLAVILLPAGAGAQVSVIGELSQDRDVRPGETYTGVIVVRNDTKESQEAKVYQTDYLFQFNGTNNYGEPGSTPRSNAKWITFSPAYITLPPEATIAVNYTVTVPKTLAGAAPIGTYWSMLMVEGIQKGSAESSAPPKDGKTQMGIMQTIRYGIQVASTIANTGTKMVKLMTPPVVMKNKEKRFIQVDIENTGDIGMRPDVYIDLFNAQGVSVGRFSGVKFRIYPGTSVRQSIDVSSVPSGNYKGQVIIDAGGEDLFGDEPRPFIF